MKTFDNHGKMLNELTTAVTKDGKVINVSTTYDTYSGRPAFQNVGVRDTNGKVTVESLINGKLLP